MARLTGSKASATRARIHESAMRLFADRGYRATHVTDIAAAAGVSVRTIHVHYRSKEAIVFGDAETSIAELATQIATGKAAPLDAVHAWVTQGTSGWLEPDVQLQHELAEQVPDVGHERTRLLTQLRDALAAGFAQEPGAPADQLAPRMAAAAMVAALEHLERVVITRVRDGRDVPPPDELDAIIQSAYRFLTAGTDALR